jgi:hypothetical protein
MGNSFNDFFNSGVQSVEPDLSEPFLYSGSNYCGIFNESLFQESLGNGGFKNIRGNTLVLRKCLLPAQPNIGEIVLKDGIRYRVLTVNADVIFYTLQLADTSK